MKKNLLLLLFTLFTSLIVHAQNNALSFDGIDDYVSIPFNVTNQYTFTIEVWINPANVPTDQIMSVLNTNSWDPYDGGSVHFQFEGGYVSLAIGSNNPPWPAMKTKLKINTWQHVAVTYDAGRGEVCFYLNGMLDSRFYGQFAPAKFTDSKIGSWSNDRFFKGKMDELVIWTNVRTPAEIKSDCKAPIPNPNTQPGLLAYYSFNHGTAGGDNAGVTSLTDASAATNNGTLNNFALTGSTSNWISRKFGKYYVVQHANGEGSSWSDASGNLKGILDNAQFCDTVWVASGIFVPAQDNDRTKSFVINSGVKVFGSFAGNETSLSQRNAILPPTILSGDIGVLNDSTDNSMTVVEMSKSGLDIVLDGLTITRGQSEVNMLQINSPSSIAGKYYQENATFGPKKFNLTADVVAAVPLNAATALTNDVSGKIVLIQRGVAPFTTKVLNAQNAGAIGVIIFNNAATDLFEMTGTDPMITIPSIFISLADGNKINENLASNTVNVNMQRGNLKSIGAAINMFNTECRINNCTISNNYSLPGAVRCDSLSTVSFTNCNFRDNKTAIDGGAVVGLYSRASFTDCRFVNNRAKFGGAIFSNFVLNTTYTNCIFENNKASVSGAAIYNAYAMYHSFENCIFSGNTASYGGALYNESSSLTLNGCKFNGNTVIEIGGASYNNNSKIISTNCQWDTNSAKWAGALFNDKNSSSEVSLSAFKANTAVGGGAIYSYKQMNITTSLFDGNLTTNNGGAINFGGGTNNLSKSIFVNNIAGDGAAGTGGGLQIDNSDTTLVNVENCLFAYNQAKGNADDGGGAITIYAGTLYMRNSTVAHNSTLTQAGAVKIVNNKGKAFIENSILWGNTAAIAGTEAIHNAGGKDSVTYSIVQADVVYPGTGNLLVNPIFLNISSPAGEDRLFGTSDDGFALQQTSPAINASNPASNSLLYDITGFERTGIYDLGAYEFQAKSGLTELSNGKMLFYPNPAADVFSVDAGEKVSWIKIYHLNGNLLLSQEVTGKSVINISSLPKGIYVVKMNGLAGKLVKK